MVTNSLFYLLITKSNTKEDASPYPYRSFLQHTSILKERLDYEKRFQKKLMCGWIETYMRGKGTEVSSPRYRPQSE